ncbi:MAG: CHAP domain-containing protein [Flavobacteriales bacterium]|nr:CHAP domain-containing protein [Flavobacteriales bacterium]
MPDSYGHAKDFFKKGIKDGDLNSQRNLTQYSNPSATKPKVKDLIIFDGNGFNPYGHVAIVSKVSETEIEITKQNPGPNAPSRERFLLNLKSALEIYCSANPL